jgi:ABC-type transport system, involved in lipoprotein release, permease component
MYFKLSLKNVRKSFKDYSLYFLTLTFGVCIFYVFNSIEAQKAMMDISESASEIMKTLTQLMGAISIFISFILGFLIVYANNFLIRRRKKEIGIYMTLGMDKGKVSRLLVAETFLIGVLSLGAGLLAGVFLSQGLSVITAKLFEVDMTGYRFIFSFDAFMKTVIYFGIIFLIVMAASTVSISKYKLIDLINAEKQNEKQRLKNPVITVILFILSVACIGSGYYMVLKNGITYFDKKLITEIILGSVGTFLFFASLSGFFLKLLQSNKKVYFKGLNSFILRQINSRINTAHISMSFICLMLFCTIGILSTGMGINDALSKSFRYCAPYDASFWVDGNHSISDKLKEYNFNLNNYAEKYVEFSLYQYSKEELAKSLIFEKVSDCLPESARNATMRSPLFLLKLSDYNKLMDLQGREEISLSENQIAIYSDYAESIDDLKKALVKFVDSKYTVALSGKDYTVYPKVLTDGIITTPASDIMLSIVVPDKMTEGSQVAQTILSLNCKGDRKIMTRKLESDLYSIAEKTNGKKEDINVKAATSEEVKAIAAGSRAIIAFVGIYLGIIFLLTSAAILALQQLSEAADNRHRYDILQKVGADDRLINSALFKQIAIYFMLPLALACVHSIVGIKVANDIIRDAGNINATGNIIMTAVLITLVYGSYFLATYFSSKRIILNNKTSIRFE